MNIIRMRGYAVRSAFLVLVAAVVTACGDGSDGSAAAQVSVPSVVGDTQAAATTAITGAKLTVGTVTQASSATVASGSVVSQTPAAATSAASGSSVALVVSSGPAPVTIPNVVGDTQAVATTAITGAGLKVGTLTQATSSTIPKGDVVSENPVAGMNVASGSAVALVISTGPVTHTVGGTLIGLGTGATVHVLNGSDNAPISANGSFTLPTAVATGGTYSVTVGTPSSTQTCGVQGGSGTVASDNVTSVVVYCTYNVTTATLGKTYTSVGLAFDVLVGGSTTNYDYVSTDTFNGVGTISSEATFNIAGTNYPGISVSETYAVATPAPTAIPSYTDNSPGLGGIEGVNAAAIVAAENMTSGSEPGIYLAVLPNTNATTASIDGAYAAVVLRGDGNGYFLAREGSGLTLSNGTMSGSLTTHDYGSTPSTVSVSSSYSVTTGTGLITTVGSLIPADSSSEGSFSGAISTDGDLIVLADIGSGDPVNAAVFLHQGTGVTAATLNGVYEFVQYGGHSPSAPDGRDAKIGTLFAYGNGTWSVIYTENTNQGTITTNNTGSGTYTVTDDGTLTLTDVGGDIYNGAVSADGNALVLGIISINQAPAIGVGVRQ